MEDIGNIFDNVSIDTDKLREISLLTHQLTSLAETTEKTIIGSGFQVCAISLLDMYAKTLRIKELTESIREDIDWLTNTAIKRTQRKRELEQGGK